MNWVAGGYGGGRMSASSGYSLRQNERPIYDAIDMTQSNTNQGQQYQTQSQYTQVKDDLAVSNYFSQKTVQPVFQMGYKQMFTPGNSMSNERPIDDNNIETIVIEQPKEVILDQIVETKDPAPQLVESTQYTPMKTDAGIEQKRDELSRLIQQEMTEGRQVELLYN
ncbi:hypothetical protein COV93_07315 [Candidatus Woesearchaeota archaeon CG11_big_fil_rev_8_21_14_0_20_43_8]|nr:MAG: hypothetical protein COV93_07315 [Candidatus Woesearchaeota archaeon CG11_big_fil_rev_8_21_14_0_20_43_8]PIO08838.1 MAG: hypothetical protein COT47_01030 [Candidatus Woesearchaeota archaeon CG08_land_8_20_14_0_20_43_7]